MKTFDAFVRGTTNGYYCNDEVYKTHLYRVELENVHLIFYDYLTDYNDLSKLNHYNKPEIMAFYIPAVQTLVVINDYYFKAFEEESVSFSIVRDDVIFKEIREKLVLSVKNNSAIQVAANARKAQEIFENEKEGHYCFDNFIKGKTKHDANCLSSFFYRNELNNNDLYEYLVAPVTYITDKTNEIIETTFQHIVGDILKEKVYDLYFEKHSREKTYAAENFAISLLNGELKNAKKIWLYLKSGQKIQVTNSYYIDTHSVYIGYYRERAYVTDINKIEYKRQVYDLESLRTNNEVHSEIS